MSAGWEGLSPPYATIVADPPWPYDDGTFFGTTEFIIYARSALTEKRQIERAGRLIKEARLAAGLTRPELHRQVRGEPLTGLVQLWETDHSLPNPRDWKRLQEVLPALAGVERPYVPPPPPKERTRVATSWWLWPRGYHSEKPAAFLDLVEHASPGPYVELFTRAQRLGWDSWGIGYEGVA